MAKDSSFDIVSEVDLQEVDNAFHQAEREIAQRYDLKGSGAAVEFSRAEGAFTVRAPADFVARQVIDVLGSKLLKRGVDAAAVTWGDPQAASGGAVRVEGRLVQGIDAALAKRIAQAVRDLKLKAKVAVEGDRLRVTSASKDTLQKVIGEIRSRDWGQPIQFTNYR